MMVRCSAVFYVVIRVKRHATLSICGCFPVLFSLRRSGNTSRLLFVVMFVTNLVSLFVATFACAQHYGKPSVTAIIMRE